MIVACWTAADSLLATLAPLGLGASAPTALVVDAEDNGPRYPSPGSLAQLVVDGPRRADLTPSRRGMAVLRNGGVALDQAMPLIEALGNGWPAVVVRLPSGGEKPGRLAGRWPVVPVVASLPGEYTVEVGSPFVAQSTGLTASVPPGAAITLPAPGRRTVASLLAGRAAPGSRWIRRWRAAWGVAW